ncbi:hypothetical protein BDM02DRAFT_3131881 [Thelephora ganbajun]|uniref:Uncharacterized protein n=1 Tax=Thelephora ganbajun TaxID=370292 RepID=A0ACB6Z3J5_THEGA|nr:hypothetical protein BDM02DRAFT_3131881 [Thelephora ganbajun]
MSLADLALELTDSIVDFLHDDPTSLKALSTTCRRFLPACRFHLFSEIALESEKLRGKEFPTALAPLVKRVRLSPGSPTTGSFMAPPFLTFGSFVVPPPPLTGPQLRQCINNIHSPHVEFKGVKVSTNHSLFTAVTTSDLKRSATSLSLNDCCVDSEDLVTLCYALPRVESLRLSAITFDKSRAMIRKVERTAPVPIGFFVPSTTSTSDWSSFSESLTSTIKTRRLHLKEIVLEGTKWTNELCEGLVGLVERIDEATELTLRAQLPVVPSRSFDDVHGENPTGQDLIGEQLELFTRFLEICGAKIDRLDVCLGNGAVHNRPSTKPNKLLPAQVESENRTDDRAVVQNVDSDVGLTIDTCLGSVLEHCPRLEALRLSGSLCSTHMMEQVIQGIKPISGHPPSLRVLGLGPVGAGILWNDVAHVLGFTGVGAGLERVVITEGDLRVIPVDARCVTLEKFDELRGKGVDVVISEHRRVGDLL